MPLLLVFPRQVRLQQVAGPDQRPHPLPELPGRQPGLRYGRLADQRAVRVETEAVSSRGASGGGFRPGQGDSFRTLCHGSFVPGWEMRRRVVTPPWKPEERRARECRRNQPDSGSGPRRDDPELDDHLGGEARLPARRDTSIHRGTYGPVLRILLLEKARDDVRVEKDPRHR